MNKPVIIYGSTTGNTETIAKWVKEALSLAGTEASLFDAANIDPESAGAYDLIILGSSTWGQGEIQDDFLPFYEAMSKEYLKGKEVAVFGCGDSSMFPDNFCQAVDLIVDKLKDCEATVVGEPLKIDGDIDTYCSEVSNWVGSLL